MRFRPRPTALLLCLALVALVAPGISRDSAQADPPEERPSGRMSRTQIFDVRIVRVDTPTPAGVEQPCALLKGAQTTTALPWPELLGLLKKRGTTRLLMDRRLTSTTGVVVRGSEERQMPILQLNSRSVREGEGGTENQAAARLRSGCKAEFLVSTERPAGASLSYKLETRGVLESSSKQAEGATETLHTWDGAHPLFGLAGPETLVLSHREQVRDPGDDAARGVEIYCFVTLQSGP
jgi:hypothetical protein